MTFGEALLNATSFFWSPMIVVLVACIALIACIALTISEAGGYMGSAVLIILYVVGGIVCLTLLIALVTYYASNGIQPLSWEHTSPA